MSSDLIINAAAGWWEAGASSLHRDLVTAWALRTIGAAAWRLAVNATAPGEAHRG